MKMIEHYPLFGCQVYFRVFESTLEMRFQEAGGTV
jgi:hypothetical protein